MANCNVNRKIFLILILLLLSVPLFSTKLFYLSTDRTFSESELKRVKVESGSLNEVKIRVYKINDTKEYFLSQDDFHRPKVVGRKFRYVTPEVVKGFKNYLKTELRSWSRDNMPGKNREVIIEQYSDLSTKNEEKYYKPSKQVDYITDKNFTLVEEKRYTFERKDNNWNTNYVYFNNLDAGTYLIEGITGDKLAYTVLNVSSFSFITKKAGDNLLLYGTTSESGEPLKDINFTVYDRFRNIIAETSSNSKGLSNLDIPDDDIFILAEDGKGNYSFYDPNYYPSSVSSRKTFIYTDRPVYKGGDLVNIKGLLRDKTTTGFKNSSYSDVVIDIYSDNGAIIKDIPVTKTDFSSFYTSIKLPDDINVGTYSVVANVDGESFESEFKVEYYIKPEFKLELKPIKNTYLTGEEINFDIGAEFYYGEPLPDLEVSYIISRSRYNFKEISRNDLDSFLSAQEWAYTGVESLSSDTIKLDSKGKGIISFVVDKEHIQDGNPYTYRIVASAKNPSGANVTTSSSTRVVSSNIRYSLNTHKFVYSRDEKITLLIDVSDYDKNPLENKFDIDVYTKDGGIKKSLTKKTVTSDLNGKAEFEYEATEPGLVYFDITGKDRAGNISVNTKSVWIGEEGASYSVTGGYVKLILDKQYYGLNDKAKLLIVSPISNIPMLLTIEGDDIYSSKVIELSENSSLVEIPIKKEYLPNAFISIDFIYENRHYSNKVKLDVPPTEQFLNIEIEPEKESFLPNSRGKVKIKVTDSLGNSVENVDLSLAVVDEAVYAISEDLTVDIRKFFYHFRRNNVMTWTSTGFRFYGYAYNIKRELAASLYRNATGIAAFKGEDEIGEEERKDFKDAILWIPNITTDSNGEAEIDVEFPSNITSWRFTVLGMDQNNRVGIKRDNIITKKDVFSSISISKVIGERDNSSAFIQLFNESEVSRELNISSELINLNGETINKNIKLLPNEKIVLKQDFKTIKDNSEDGQISVKVTEGIIIHDVTSKTIKIKNFSLNKSFIHSKNITSTENSMEFSLPPDMNNGADTFTLSLINGLTGHILGSLNYLSQYPYGCAEQTTNKFLPNAMIVEAFDRAGIPLSYDKDRLEKNITNGITTLLGYQNENGSWGWWQHRDGNLYMASYVLYGLTTVNELGYYVNYAAIESGVNYLKDNIHNGEMTEKLFGLYVLSLNGVKVDSIFRSLDPEGLSDYQLALYLLISREYNRSESVKNSVKLLLDRAKTEKDNIYWGSLDSRDWSTNHIETTSWVIKALAPYVDKDELYRGINHLLEYKNGDVWNSTRDTSAAIMAMSEVLYNTEKIDTSLTAQLNGKNIGTIDLRDNKHRVDIDVDTSLLKDKNILTFKGLSDNPYTSIINIKYFTNDKEIKSSSFGSNITRKYYKLEPGNILGDESRDFEKGDLIVVELDYTQDKNGDYIMLTDNYPAGTEFNRDLDANVLGNTGEWNIPDSINNQFDKVNIFYSYGGNKKFYYVLNAVYPGTYSVNPATGELMYFPDVRSNSDSDQLIIKGDK